VIWAHQIEIQSAYYPFLDLLHTIMPIVRYPFTSKTIALLGNGDGLFLTRDLNVAFAREHGVELITASRGYTTSVCLLGSEAHSTERSFSKELERLYEGSRVLVIDELTAI
jgi:hypothetical protein